MNFTYVAVVLLPFVFWLAALIGVINRQFSDPTMKIVWLLVVILLGPLGAAIYFFGSGQPMAPTGKGPEFSTVRVANYRDRISAESVKSILESNGINCFIIADDAGGAESPILTGGMGTWVVVSSPDEQRAREVLRTVSPSEPGSDEVDERQLNEEAMSYAPPEDA